MVQYFNLHVIDTFSIVDIVEVIDADIYGYRWMGLGWLDISETYKFLQIYNPRWMEHSMDGIGIGMGIAGWGANDIFHCLGEILHLNWCMHACIFVEMFANSIGGEDFSVATL